MAATRDFAWIAIGRLVTALVALAAIRLSTALLPPEQFGILAILLTFQVFCGLFLINPVGQYINRHTHAWMDEGTLLLRLRPYRIWVVAASLAGAATSGAWTLFQPLPRIEQLSMAVSVAIMVIAATWNATSVSLLNMLGHRALSVAWAGATVLAGLLLSWWLVSLHGIGFAWFVGQALGMAIGAIGAGWTVRRALHSQQLSGHWPLLEPRALLGYILPLAVATGFMWWLLSGYRLLLEAHWGLAALGQAVVGLTLASQLWGLVESLAMQFLFPLFYRRISTEGTPDSAIAFSDLLNTLGPIYLLLAAATVAGAPALLALLVDVSYSHVVPFVLLGAFIECCRALGNLLATAAQVDRRMKMLVPPYAVGAMVLTLGVLILAHRGGTVEQAVAVIAVAGFITLIAMTAAMSRLQTFHMDVPRWCAALALVVLAVFLVDFRAPAPLDFVSALKTIAVLGVLVSVAFAALLWKNPGARRLLAVRLSP